ncbi:MAG: efflux RND transporter permease subunit [Synergistaceae bacterium]|nr:efflux RND transporter permease subunit [Synergistota bacterium]NLM71674.1 efflux RND transporter permease subunit [Synergistaceae bacterium]
MRGLIRFSIKRPVFTWAMVFVFLLLGISSYNKIPVALLPKVDIPIVLVRAVYRGASPNEIERLVTKPIEDAIADLEGLDKITSYSAEGMSLVLLEMKVEVDVDLALVDISNKVKVARYKLPTAVEEPIFAKVDINAFPFLIASFTSNLPEKDARKVIEDTIVPILSRVEGVGRADVTGGRVRQIRILLDPVSLSEHRVNIQTLAAVVAANNVTNPSGYITQEKDETWLRLVGEFDKVEDLENIMIPTPSGNPVRLRDLGRIVDAEEDVRSIARVNGQSVVQLRVSARPNSDVVKAGKLLRKELDKLLKTMPDFSAEIAYDDSLFVESTVTNVLRDMGVGILLTSLVLYLFLKRFSATFIVAIAMPVALLATFTPMVMHGYSMNIMSSLGLAISMGVLVNNAILIIENIFRYRDMGYSPEEAAERGTAEISLSVIAGTATNLGVFLPVAIMSGIAGQFLVQYAMTIVYATLFSLWVSLTLTPSMAARFKPDSGIPRIGQILCGWWDWVYSGFEGLFLFLLKAALRRPLATVLLFLALTFGVFKAGGLLGMEFMPNADSGAMSVEISLPCNTPVQETQARAKEIEDRMSALPGVEFVVSTVGASGRNQGTHKASIEAYFKKGVERPSTVEMADELRPFVNSMPGVDGTVSGYRGGMGGMKPISIIINGEDLETLYGIAQDIKSRISGVPGIIDAEIDVEMGKPELQILPVRWRLSQFGINMTTLSQVVYGYLVGMDAGKFRQGGYEYDIKARINPEYAKDIFKVTELPIMTEYGLVPLKEFADVQWRDGPTEIVRKDRRKAVTVGADVRYISAGEAIEKARQAIAGLELPPGYELRFGGEAEFMAENFAELGKALLIAVALTFIIIAAILESWFYAFVITLSVPLAALGVIPTMLMAGVPVSMFALIGLIMLVGLVVNNSIVVIDYAEIRRRDEGEPGAVAVAKACEIRLRMLFMAIATAVISMVPLAAGTGDGGVFRQPIAFVAIGGLVAGGIIALLAIPAVYSLYWNFRERRAARRAAA